MTTRLGSVLNILTLNALLLSLLGSAVTFTPARAATFNVANAAELIAAINTANANGESDTISLTTDIVLTAVDHYVLAFGSTGLPAILADGGNPLTIEGNGFSISRDASAPNFRILRMDTGANLTLNNIIISNGYITDGGGILNWQGTLKISNSTIAENFTAGSGGGISNYGNTTVEKSTLYKNGAQFSGGGIFNFSILSVDGSTFIENSASSGGGISTDLAITITNSTFYENDALNHGGGLWNDGATIIQNSTFYRNGAVGSGGNVYHMGGSAQKIVFRNSIVALSTASDNCYIFANLVENGGNNIDDGSSCEFGSANGSMSNTDPKLGPLTNNGGSTQTLALLLGSPAIEGVVYNAPNSAPATDQRGIARPQFSRHDIGAYEYREADPPAVTGASLPGAIPLLESQQVAIGVTQIIVRFDQDLLNDGSADAANNPSNYLLVRAAGNGIQTQSCASGAAGGDTQIPIDSVTFDSAAFEATLNINGGTALPAGVYQLFVCGTTSIVNLFGDELYGGWVDYDLGFSVPATTTTGGTGGTGSTGSAGGSGGTASLVALPNTGFAPNRVTSLPEQPADSSYIRLGNFWMEVPSLNIKSDIVGVPQSGSEWDVTWLGNSVGWLNGTAFPTWEGNSVLTAHVTNPSGLAGPFAELGRLKHGDQIIIHMDEQRYIFEVRESKLVRPDTTAFALQDLEDNAYLTLITCQGYNPLNDSYLFRRVVRAVLVEVK